MQQTAIPVHANRPSGLLQVCASLSVLHLRSSPASSSPRFYFAAAAGSGGDNGTGITSRLTLRNQRQENTISIMIPAHDLGLGVYADTAAQLRHSQVRGPSGRL
eukprot:784379-Rhodomonas_salina.1